MYEQTSKLSRLTSGNQNFSLNFKISFEHDVEFFIKETLSNFFIMIRFSRTRSTMSYKLT